MNKKLIFPILVLALLISTLTDAQVIMRKRAGGRIGPKPRQRISQNLPKFKPTVNISIGYGFPNLDKTYLPDYYDAYKGDISQTGPVIGSLDYQFSRRMSIGVIITHGSVSAPYYGYYSSSSLPVFTTKFDNWSFMLNMVRYIPVSYKITPYIRTAIGVNSWKQEYTDAEDNKVLVEHVDLPDLAYQVGLGAKFNLSKNAALFVEAGYGKYILNGGLSLKF